MLIVKLSERNCCTCDHWSGTRIVEEDGFVYSLENLEGVCTLSCRSSNEMVVLSTPSGTCGSWKFWEVRTEPLRIDYTEYLDNPAYAFSFERVADSDARPGAFRHSGEFAGV
ncbi:MAG: hypothetical protein KGZ83_21990 [Sulfuricella sp.]|nr:hypothetical protein [Sulfuricella sp.]